MQSVHGATSSTRSRMSSAKPHAVRNSRPVMGKWVMEVIPLGPGFAAEVRGCGLENVAQEQDAYDAVREAFEEHSVLLFRGQPVTDELQVDYSKRFGPLEVAKVATLAEGTCFSVL